MNKTTANNEEKLRRWPAMKFPNRKIWLICGALILVSFLIGFVPVTMKNQSLNDQLQERERTLAHQASELQKQRAASGEKVRLAGLNNQLGMLLIMTQEKNFSEARERSTRFFDELRQFTQETQDNSLREKLMGILNRRDEITSDLTATDAGTAVKLRMLYQEMYRLSVADQ
jgi:hypothetical protein